MERPVVSLVSDLRVKRERLTVIRPEVVTQRRTLFLSNTDQQLMHFLHKIVHFFSVDVGLSSDAIIDVYTQALSRLMVFYDFMCGRLVFNSEQGRFEVDCNSAGVPLSICTSDLSLQQLGDLSYPNPAFTQLILLPGDASQTPEDEPFISFQITHFRSGGFAFGTAVNHGLMDGFSLQEFARNFTSIVKKGEVAFEPIADRTCLKARSPLQIKYKHEEFMKPSETATKAMNSPSFDVRNNKAMQNPSEEHVFGLFSLSGEMIEVLKMKAKDGGVKHCTGSIAAMAHLWRARTAAMENMAADDVSTFQLVVDIRSRLVPPLPREFAGNAIATAYANATARELHEKPFGEIVKKLQEGVDRITDEYVRSGIDWLELHDGRVCIENGLVVTLWTHLGFGEMDVGGWIKSVYGGPVVSGYVGVVIMLAHPTDKEGIQIFMGLESSHMIRFHKLIKNVDAVTIHSNM